MCTIEYSFLSVSLWCFESKRVNSRMKCLAPTLLWLWSLPVRFVGTVPLFNPSEWLGDGEQGLPCTQRHKDQVPGRQFLPLLSSSKRESRTLSADKRQELSGTRQLRAGRSALSLLSWKRPENPQQCRVCLLRRGFRGFAETQQSSGQSSQGCTQGCTRHQKRQQRGGRMLAGRSGLWQLHLREGHRQRGECGEGGVEQPGRRGGGGDSHKDEQWRRVAREEPVGYTRGKQRGWPCLTFPFTFRSWGSICRRLGNEAKQNGPWQQSMW